MTCLTVLQMTSGEESFFVFNNYVVLDHCSEHVDLRIFCHLLQIQYGTVYCRIAEQVRLGEKVERD